MKKNILSSAIVKRYDTHVEEKLFYLGFSLFPGIGSAKFAKLLDAFGSASAAWSAKASELLKILGPALIDKFLEFRSSIDLQKEQEKLIKKEILFVTPLDKEYPTLLKHIAIQQTLPLIPSARGEQQNFPSNGGVAQRDGEGNSNGIAASVRSIDMNLPPRNDEIRIPYVLYVKGNVEVLNNPKTIGIVGTRKISNYGREVTELFTSEIVAQGFTTVSGLAFGVDTVVAEKTIDAGGKTIAVLGCGVDCCTPVSNQRIYNRILDSGGAIVSTFKPGEEANKGSFPARNAIIAGLSQAILVTEGAADSGALITADYAKKFGRPVFAIPGPITSDLSKGPNGLIQKGCIPVTNSLEILDSLGIITQVRSQKSKVKSIRGETKDEQEIIDLLAIEPLHFDQIVRTIGKSTKEIGTLLSMMELKGLVKSSGSIYSVVNY